MHFLLTNDDGIDAPGLAALAAAVSNFPGAQVSIVATTTEHSQCAHRVTTHRPLKVEARGDRRWAVDGTPADCVRVALFGLNLKPDWVISGVNAGGNMGQDIVISGTVAAAREAAYHGIPSMAFSHYLIKDIPVDWARISIWVTDLIGRLSAKYLHDGEFWNINFPHHPPGSMEMPEPVPAAPERLPLNVAFVHQEDGYLYNARYAERPHNPGSDVATCFEGKIAISRLKI